ncbi:MAG: Uncharacterised protein [Cryomorphaceae bacterium]|nr:MAG: Uncharacterised protein [Cryomorphaceae bacterium]
MVTLHLPPPDTFTFTSILSVFSKIVTFAFGLVSFAVIAAINPAAPPPITAIFIISFLLDQKELKRKKVEILSER